MKGASLSGFENKLLIHGIVECSCGGILISNSGKILMSGNQFLYLKCNKCKNEYDIDKVYSQRIENKTIIYNEKI